MTTTTIRKLLESDQLPANLREMIERHLAERPGSGDHVARMGRTAHMEGDFVASQQDTDLAIWYDWQDTELAPDEYYVATDAGVIGGPVTVRNDTPYVPADYIGGEHRLGLDGDLIPSDFIL